MPRTIRKAKVLWWGRTRSCERSQEERLSRIWVVQQGFVEQAIVNKSGFS